MNTLYLIVNLAVIGVPLAFSWHNKNRFYDHWASFWTACLLVMSFFIAWDILFTSKGIWGFEAAYLTGLSLAGLPLEEWLFFITVPYACTFTYFVLASRSKPQASGTGSRVVSGIVALGCLFLVVFFWGHWYTSSTAFFCLLFAAFLYKKRPFWQPVFLRACLILMVPFVLTNGVLTGLKFWQHPIINTHPENVVERIVWYDNAHNMGVRLFSIPLDDFLYAFLLIGMNIMLFEGLRRGRMKGSATESIPGSIPGSVPGSIPGPVQG